MSLSETEPEDIPQGEDLSWEDMCYSQYPWYLQDVLDVHDDPQFDVPIKEKG